MHPIEQQLYSFLNDCCEGKAEVPEHLYTEFSKRCEDAVRKHLSEKPGKDFTLRMSNIGRPLRQLMLEKKYGRGTPSPEFLLRMLAGTLDEAFMLFLFKAAGINVTKHDHKVTLPVTIDNNTVVNVDGTFDVETDGRNLWDFKTASPYSYDNKFTNYEVLAKRDDFGYMGQGFGYAKAYQQENKDARFKGWIVRNKATGDFKVIEIPDYKHTTLSTHYVGELLAKVEHITLDKPIPKCEGEVEETYYKKLTGNRVLLDVCKYCPHKEVCHPGIKYCQSLVGKSEAKWKWYTKIGQK